MNRPSYQTPRAQLLAAIMLAVTLVGAACGSESTTTASQTQDTAAESGGDGAAAESGGDTAAAESGGGEDTDADSGENAVGGVRVVSPQDGEAILESSNPDLVVLDVRTPDEYAQGHLPDATLIDFYDPNFQSQIDALDKDKEYLVYCRSGNRSGQAREMMAEMGFSSVADIDGGIVAWEADGLSVTTE